MDRLTCKHNLPHRFIITRDFAEAQYEVCELCGYKIRSKKDNRGRTDNIRYLKLHSRDTCQPRGRTKALYMKIYHPKYCVIRPCLDEDCNLRGLCLHKTGVRQQLRVDHRVKPPPGTTYWDA